MHNSCLCLIKMCRKYKYEHNNRTIKARGEKSSRNRLKKGANRSRMKFDSSVEIVSSVEGIRELSGEDGAEHCSYSSKEPVKMDRANFFESQALKVNMS